MDKKYVLVINCGSSSIKFAVFDLATDTHVYHGVVDNISHDSCHLSYSHNNEIKGFHLANASFEIALLAITKMIRDDKTTMASLIAIGHRVVHGGPNYNKAVKITSTVVKELEKINNLAPLHNPSNLAGIKICIEAFPKIKNVAVFDTAFHATIPSIASSYAIDRDLAKELHIKRYGFHGISHEYVYNEVQKLSDKKKLNVISAHLGNGASITAIRDGISVDTSMGFTPLAGLVMGTRSGDIDPGLHEYLASSLNISIAEVTTLLNKKSGLQAISKISHDMRKLEDEYNLGNPDATLAIEIFCYNIAKYISSYMVPLVRLDAIVFTGGIGENSPLIRKIVVDKLKHLHLLICIDSNNHNGDNDKLISQATSSVPIYVIKTNEELLIAKQAAGI